MGRPALASMWSSRSQETMGTATPPGGVPVRREKTRDPPLGTRRGGPTRKAQQRISVPERQ